MEEEVDHFGGKCITRLPMYGLCRGCYNAGPTGLICMTCKEKKKHNHNQYIALCMRKGKKVYRLDLQHITEIFNMEILPARANRKATWIVAPEIFFKEEWMMWEIEGMLKRKEITKEEAKIKKQQAHNLFS